MITPAMGTEYSQSVGAVYVYVYVYVNINININVNVNVNINSAILLSHYPHTLHVVNNPKPPSSPFHLLHHQTNNI